MDNMDYEINERPQPDLEATLDVLRASDSAHNSTLIYGLCRLDETGIKRLEPVWAALDLSYRRTLMHELVEASETNFELDYGAFGHFALDAEDAEIRSTAIELLWEDQTLVLMRRLTADDDRRRIDGGAGGGSQRVRALHHGGRAG